MYHGLHESTDGVTFAPEKLQRHEKSDIFVPEPKLHSPVKFTIHSSLAQVKSPESQLWISIIGSGIKIQVFVSHVFVAHESTRLPVSVMAQEREILPLELGRMIPESIRAQLSELFDPDWVFAPLMRICREWKFAGLFFSLMKKATTYSPVQKVTCDGLHLPLSDSAIQSVWQI
jgi:hypothetical protein